MHAKHAAAAAVSFLAIFLIASLAPVGATPQPADKLGTSGSALEFFGSGTGVVLLSGVLQASAPTDLLITASLECSILGATDGHLEAWIEVDGAPLAVAGSEDDGRVVACDHAHPLPSLSASDDDEEVQRYLATRHSASFQWLDFDVGAGVHSIGLWARLTDGSPGSALAEGVVGKRTLVVDPSDIAAEAVV